MVLKANDRRTPSHDEFRGPRSDYVRQRSQTLAQITTHLNYGDIHTVSKRTVQYQLHRMGFGRRRPMRIPLLNAHHRVARLA
ncbi:hypothetical protein TNCV_4506111 [Trichonephila clavipes]|nr:hypothetical protein TNCV_4506111 [Trichonephila clavipes]